jgi:hypothetical protein
MRVLILPRIFYALAPALGILAGVIFLPFPAFANAQDTSVMVSTSVTTETADCHYSTGGWVYNTRYMFDGDQLIINYVHNETTKCVTNFNFSPDDSRWYYSQPWVKINASDGPSGVEGPNAPVTRGSDRRCTQESATDPGAGGWASVPYFVSQVSTTVSSSVTDSGANRSEMYAYDNVPCGYGFWGDRQIVYVIKPVEPQVTSAFASPAVLVNAPVDLIVTVSNTQVFRSGAYGTFTGLGFTLALPAGATGNASGASTTCRGGSVTTPSGSTQIQLSGASLGGAGHSTEASCTVTVPVTFTTEGSKALTSASLIAGATNRGSIYNNTAYFNKVAANVTVSSAIISPATQNLSGNAGAAITPTTPFTPQGLTAPITYSISPALPDGLSINPQSGVVSGTPKNQQDALTYTITASDGSKSATAQVTITIAAASGGGGSNSGLPDTGTSLRIVGITLGSALMLYIAGIFIFRGRRQLGFAAVNEKVSARMRELDAMLTRMEDNARRRRNRRRN